MKRFRVRAIQLVILAALVLVIPPPQTEAGELQCYLICLALDWHCIVTTGSPAEPCSYQAAEDICNVGGCWKDREA